MATVYVETTIVSYLTARPSRDAVLAAHQTLTRDWWLDRATYELRVSQLVIDEASVGDEFQRARRLRALRGIPVLSLTDSATRLARALVRQGALPQRGFASADHLHPRGTTCEEAAMKRRDAIIEDLHKLRERIGRAHGFDVDRIAVTIREHERDAGRPLLEPPLEGATRRRPRARRKTAQHDLQPTAPAEKRSRGGL